MSISSLASLSTRALLISTPEHLEQLPKNPHSKQLVIHSALTIIKESTDRLISCVHVRESIDHLHACHLDSESNYQKTLQAFLSNRQLPHRNSGDYIQSFYQLLGKALPPHVPGPCVCQID